MGWFRGPDPDEVARREQARQRAESWDRALRGRRLPDFVEGRLRDARAGRAPWLATLTAAELLLVRSHGLQPVATVSGTCWYNYRWSWTEGHAEGWHMALDRIKAEALAAGANAIVDVKLRTTHLAGAGTSMDYTVLGTAVAMDGLPPSRDPVVATVGAVEFVRLLEAGIVATGVAIGARYDWLTANRSTFGSFGMSGDLRQLTAFWEGVRRRALADLRTDAARLGDGVLAHTHFAQLIRTERDEQPAQVLGRHIVLGTAVQCGRRDLVPHGITPVVDMRDGASSLTAAAPRSHTAYGLQVDQEGAI